VRDGDHAQCNTIIQSLQADINRLNHQLTDSSIQGKNTRTLQLEIDRLNKLLKESSSSSAINKSADVRSL
jgi:predicted RNase H-like nuclease (RuvC/YqgF family)